jgi:predicted dehydrogenase
MARRPPSRRRSGPVPVALFGAAGHGLWHRRVIADLQHHGRVRLAAVCDPAPLAGHADAPLDGVAVFTEHRSLLAEVPVEAAIVCTPPHTHLRIALDALDAGADVLLEKPPVADLAEHDALERALARTGGLCQVGFQALGAAALDELIAAIGAGAAGTVRDITAVGAWWRPDSYWQRAPWAGRRELGGRPIVDGALANPFAHALMECLAIAEAAGAGPPVTVELERYRTADIEVDDTAFLRVALDGGVRVLVAVSLAASDLIAGEVTVRGDRDEAVLEYPTDRLKLPGQGWRTVPGRIGLLENLLDHRADPALPLRVPLHRTRAFTALLDPILIAPPPVAVPRRYLIGHAGGDALAGVAAVLRRCAETGALPSELGVPWAREPCRLARA